MPRPLVIAVRREPRFVAPGAADDALLDRVMEELSGRGATVRPVQRAAQAEAALGRCGGATILNMCRGEGSLALLSELSWHTGVRCINSGEGTRATLRDMMLPRLAAIKVATPPTRTLPRRQCERLAPMFAYPLWLKPPLQHSVQGQGVRLVSCPGELLEALDQFDAAGGCDQVLLQRHLDGGVEVKFYGAGHGGEEDFFHCGPGLSPGARAAVRAMAMRAARGLGVQIYGGDSMVIEGRPLMLDFNAWPSFGPCLVPAAEAIADLALEPF